MDYSDYGPGTLAFLIVAAIGLALFFLLKSMNKQMKKIHRPDGRPEEDTRRDRNDT